ncbi:methylated-DNA--[protein]-cysteine S-methyltransferase [Luteolibacter algae]|uniref:Methylated-DNA--[protein]-cysteine S-methyltransferase n=1 Tax=Luteolibacter algae TaxID=454151 RepID=A0ABW5DC53_9BACT
MNDYERIARVIRHLDEAFMHQPALDELSQVAGLSSSHFHRMFVKWAGVTPKDFIQALTMDYAMKLLRDGESILHTSLESGLSGPSRLHDLCLNVHAATPGEIKSGGVGMEIRWGLADSPFGNLFLAMTPKGISHLSFYDDCEADSLEAVHADWPLASLVRDDKSASDFAARIFTDYPDARSHISLFVKGTAFQQKVWRALLNIPENKLTTYGKLARDIGQDKSARAVGNAVGRNRISYLIPCHRVIRETGISGGYRWGQLRKRIMISREQARAFTQR